MGIIATIIIGAIAGWLGSLVYKGTNLGILGNIIVGVFGSFVGNWILVQIQLRCVLDLRLTK